MTTAATPAESTTESTTEATPVPVPHRRTTTALALGVPAALAAVTVAVALSWRDRLPDPVASHWGPDGIDGSSSLVGLLVPLVAMTLAFAAVLWAVGYFWGSAAMTRRFAVGTAVWVAVFVDALVVVMLAAQLDVATAADARDLGAGLAAAIVGALAVAGTVAWLIPGDPRRPTGAPIPAGAPRLALPESETATWVRRVRWVHPAWIVAGSLGFAAAMGAATRSWWFALAIAAFLVGLLVTVTAWTVTVDRHGLVAHSRLPRPRVVVPLEEVEHAEVVRVNPLREFGGWGLRTGLGGRVGVVVRKGEALEVVRTGGRRVVVTVDDAATGAALLNTLAARTRA